MIEIWIMAELVHKGTDLHDSGGLVFCRLQTHDKELVAAFDEEKSCQDGAHYLVPAVCENLLDVEGNLAVRPEYVPHLWGVVERPPETVLVPIDRVISR